MRIKRSRSRIGEGKEDHRMHVTWKRSRGYSILGGATGRRQGLEKRVAINSMKNA